MNATQDRRGKYRRYIDRRVAVMLQMYELFFDEPAGTARDIKLLEIIQDDFGTDIAAFVRPINGSPQFHLLNHVGDWQEPEQRTDFSGQGIELLLDSHEHAPGAVTLTRVRRPSSFEQPRWDSLWRDALGDRSKALLSVGTQTAQAEPIFLWLVQTGYSREWNSQDAFAERHHNDRGHRGDAGIHVSRTGRRPRTD